MKNVKREINSNELLIKSLDQTIILNMKEFLQKNKISGIIRIQKKDFIFLKTNPYFLTHFNLQFSDHKKGKIYALLMVVKPGSLDKKKEIYPILSLKNTYVAECFEVRNNLQYDELKKEDFKYSFPGIKNSKQLKEVIIERYSRSMPNLSKEKILSLGVGITELRSIKKIKINKL